VLDCRMKQILIIFFIFLPFLSSGQSETEISTQDITHFWEAYDSLASSKDSVSTFQRLYINRATPGFKEFIKARDFTAKEYVTLIKRYPKYWISIRPNTERIASRIHEIEEVFKRFKVVYPEFHTPYICFAIGCLRTGGTTTYDLILIGSEIASADSTTNKIEFTGWLQYVIGNTGDIVAMVAHEAVHTQQPNNAAFIKGQMGHRLLSQSLREGAADFIGMKVTGFVINKTQYAYGIEHEAALWKEFQSEMFGNDYSAWLYNGNKAGDRPADLGYFMGARICESYFNRSTDKEKAIRDIIRMKNNKKFLKRSGYSGGVN
jgi:hypothetical protein